MSKLTYLLKKTRFSISISGSVILFVACVVAAFFMPAIVDMLIEASNDIADRNNITGGEVNIVLTLGYLLLAVMIAADILLFILLRTVRCGQVFTEKSSKLIGGVSWCCFMLSAVLCALGLYFILSFILAFGVFFLGTCIRIVMKVIEEATLIKSENDLTV